MRRVSTCLAVLLLSASAPAGVSGWRGDGSGQYQKATPPVRWGRTSDRVLALRHRATRPAGEAASGQPMADGVIREWLVLAPVPMGSEKDAPDPLGLGDEAKLSPDEGDEAGGLEWKRVPVGGSTIHFGAITGKVNQEHSSAAYAHAYVYSASGGNYLVNLNHMGPVRIWLNGKLAMKPKETDVNYWPRQMKLEKGWNRLLIRVTPVLKTHGSPKKGTWYASVSFFGHTGSQYVSRNIRWSAQPPSGHGFGAPVLAGNRLFLLSGYADLVCMDKMTGKVLWVRSSNYDDLATAEEKAANPEVFGEIAPLAQRLKAINDSFASAGPPKIAKIGGDYGHKEKRELEKKIYTLMRKVDRGRYGLPKGQDVGYSGLTPVTDGRRVWAWFATGVTVCCDTDGKVIWRRLDNKGPFFEHGYSTSPLLVDGRLLVCMKSILCLDAATGKLIWEKAPDDRISERFHGSFAPATVGGQRVIITPVGYVLRLSDGKTVFKDNRSIRTMQQEIPTAVVAGDCFFKMTVYSTTLYRVKLPRAMGDPLQGVEIAACKVDTTKYPSYYNYWHMASPVILDGLVYLLSNHGVFTVVDARTMQIVYQRMLDVDLFQNHHEGAARGIGVSPTLAGKHLYVSGNTGSTLVLKPGRKYEQVAKNRLESILYRRWGTRSERFVACPVFDGGRIYIRGELNLYCIEGK